jgi:hypothetical protein
MRLAIRHGIMRTVFLVGDWAIKVPRPRWWAMFLRGFLANIHEGFYWANTRDARLCPVVWVAPAGLAIVMRRAEPWPESVPLPAGFGDVSFDVKEDNLGVLDGRPVMVDYGEFYSPESVDPRQPEVVA